MKSLLKAIPPLIVLWLAGCAGAPPSPPAHYVPYGEPAHPQYHPRHKKPQRKPAGHAASKRRPPHRATAAGTAPGHAGGAVPGARAAEKKTRPQRPVVLYANDASLAQQVNAALNNDPTLRGAHIQVRAYQGTIGLAGQVANAAQKDRAVAIAGNVTGVKMVSDQLTTAH